MAQFCQLFEILRFAQDDNKPTSEEKVMKASLKTKLDQLLERYDELGALLSDSETINDQNMFRAYSKEYAEIEPVVLCYRRFEGKNTELDEARLMLQDAFMTDCAATSVKRRYSPMLTRYLSATIFELTWIKR